MQRQMQGPSLTNIIFSANFLPFPLPPKCPSIFANQNIFTQSPPPLQRIWEADWQFQQQNHSSGKETDATNLRAPRRCHGNTLNKRGWQQKGEGGGERRYDQMWTLFRFDSWYTTQFLLLDSPASICGSGARTCFKIHVFQKNMHTHTNTQAHNLHSNKQHLCLADNTASWQ